MSLVSIIKKATVGTVVAAVIAIGGFGYGCYTQNSEIVYLCLGAALTWLYKTKESGEEE